MSALIKKEKIGIVGSGFIGRSWAMLFASGGYHVSMYDSNVSQLVSALADIQQQLKQHEKNGVLRGKLTADEQFGLIGSVNSLSECVTGAIHVQECVFEDVDLKRQVFTEMDALASDQVVLCSSTSCFPPSKFMEGLKHREQAIVGHPVNPPYYVPLVELVPSAWTSEGTLVRTRALMREIGQKPVLVKKEVPGFIINRIQYAILNECWRLVEDDVISSEDIDTVMSDGLGMRYAFMGPLETAYLNADGMVDYCRRYAAGIYRVSQTFGPNPKWEGPMVERLERELGERVPLDGLQQRRAWRDGCLRALAKLKQELDH